ncbi:MAG TPA: hypothetical protein VJ483_05155 [Holophagaceae bacterium]|nr:hypothetical protein [Holophagaceae bacterium]
MLFQVEGLERPKAAEAPPPTPQVLQAPALGRVTPVAVSEALSEAMTGPPEPAALGFSTPVGEVFESLEARVEAEVASFWPLVLMEASEAALLGALNLLALLAACLVLQVWPWRLLREAWILVLPFHLGLSWAALMVPLVLSGQSPLMPRWGLVLAESEAERRMVFSLVHLVSVLAFPLSFLCMVLSPRHQSLAEYLSGQEIINKPPSRMR